MAKKRAARYPGRRSGKARCATTVPATEHVQVFGRTRPSHSGTYAIHEEPEGETHILAAPAPHRCGSIPPRSEVGAFFQ